MAIIITGIESSKVISTLETYNYTTTSASMHIASLELTEQPPSGCVITISQNGAPKLVTSVPAATQNHIEAKVLMNCAASDLISIAITSATTSDSNINSIKGILRITLGPY